MEEFIVCQSYLKTSKIKGKWPDVVYSYISNDSDIGFHHTLTNDREKAYIFGESQLEIANFISECWEMKIVKLDYEEGYVTKRRLVSMECNNRYCMWNSFDQCCPEDEESIKKTTPNRLDCPSSLRVDFQEQLTNLVGDCYDILVRRNVKELIQAKKFMESQRD
ncbi:hypothetical protein ACM26V_00300 [Salipaludibacillus sp. HK11]|uniref:hypothetical protein n=1 Tax=Salipaludibacillus sp. HK11 TaxID=3394320 RepID=UPI0039FBDAA7